MNAPDKIYIYREPPKNYFEDEWGESEVNDMESIPYIRKDALLEWAKETYLSENASQIRKVCFKQLIDKIESL